MDDVPVKISERCRPPPRVSLPSSFRRGTSSTSATSDAPYSFDLERNSLYWIQERRANLVSAREERRKRLVVKDAEVQKRNAELKAAQEEAEKLIQERQREEDERLKREREEQEKLRHELEQEKLNKREEKFRQEKEEQDRVQKQAAERTGIEESSSAVNRSAEVGVNSTEYVGESVRLDVMSSSQLKSSDLCNPHCVADESNGESHVAAVSNGPTFPVAQTASQVLSNTAVSHQMVHQYTQQNADTSQSHATSTTCTPSTYSTSGYRTSGFPTPSSAASTAAASSVNGVGNQRVPVAAPQSPSSAVLTPQPDFNYRDFESQASDPFDSVALKTINDMEVLASVFHGRPAASSDPSSSGSDATTSGFYNQSLPPASSSLSYTRPQYNSTAPVYHPTSGGFRPVASVTGAYSYQSYGLRAAYSPASTSVYRPPQTLAAPVRHSAGSAAGAVRPYTTTSTGSAAGSIRPSIPYTATSTGPASRSVGPSGPYTATSTGSAVGSVCHTATSSGSDPRRLQEFYARYYQPPPAVTSATAADALPGLRASRSVPDLGAELQRHLSVEDSTAVVRNLSSAVHIGRTKSHTPPPTQQQPLRSTQVAAGSSAITAQPTSSASLRVSPPASMQPSVWIRLQQISEMGFPLDRLVKLHDRFNGDEKKVIDVALAVRGMEETGHGGPAAELALMECDGDAARAVEFCRVYQQLVELGFPGQRVVDALRRGGLCRDRALDLLVQG